MPKRERKPLSITCTSSDCESGLHCFKATRQMRERNEEGRCRSCGVDLIAWDRIHQRDAGDVEHTFAALKKEMFRHHYWHIPIDQYAMNHARRKGWTGLKIALRARLAKYLGTEEPNYDGRQTPLKGNSIFYAQHAVAGCCRKCLEYWHGIEMGRELSSDELNYIEDLCLLYLKEKLPELTQDGKRVPPIRRASSQGSD